jgi:hypothetical protein
MKVSLLLFSAGILLLGGCSFIKKKEDNRFPIKFNLKNYTIVNQIPLRKGGNLDHLLELEKWAQEVGRASGLSGEGLFSLLDGRVDLVREKKDVSKKSLVSNSSKQSIALNIVVSVNYALQV